MRHFTTEHCEPLVCESLLDGKSFDLSFYDSVKPDGDFSNLADFELFVAEKLETRLWESKGVVSVHCLESWVTSSLSFFNSTEESIEGFDNSVINVLENLGMDFFKRRIDDFNVWKQVVKFDSVGKSSFASIDIPFIFKHRIIEKSTGVKDFIHFCLDCFTWVNPEFVSFHRGDIRC